jgi:uncharacterized membrane protein YgcG
MTSEPPHKGLMGDVLQTSGNKTRSPALQSGCRVTNDMRAVKKRIQSQGFSLLEAILAIGVLSIVVVQIVNVQSASMEIAAVSRANQGATWALRSATAQLQYVLDAYGVEGLRPTQEFTAGPEKEFTVLVRTEETSIEASRLLVTALRMASVFGGQGPEDDRGREQEEQYKEIGQILDSQVPKDIYRTVQINVSWTLGGSTRQIDGGFLVVDDKALTLGSDIASLGGGGSGGGGNGGGGNGGGGNGGEDDGAGGSDGSDGESGSEVGGDQ